MTSLFINPALSAFAPSTGKVAGQAARRTLTLVLLFFEARGTMARRLLRGRRRIQRKTSRFKTTSRRPTVIAVVASPNPRISHHAVRATAPV